MIKRRDFLRGFIGARVLMGINPESVLVGGEKREIEDVSAFKEKAWMKTIFCCFENPALAMKIGESAEQLKCDVFWGDPNSPDIIAIPYFIAIVERGPFSVRQLMEYWEFCRETDDGTPLIIVDAFHNFNSLLPKLKNKLVLQFDPVDQDAIEQIVKFIRLERARVLSEWRKWAV